MSEEDSEEYILLQRALNEMKEKSSEWVALPTNYSARKNLSLTKNICLWYGYGALPCTDFAIQNTGGILTSAEYRKCIPRPGTSAGLIITEPKHPLMEAYLHGWAAADDKRSKTRQREILKYVECRVISAEQASAMLDFDS